MTSFSDTRFVEMVGRAHVATLEVFDGILQAERKSAHEAADFMRQHLLRLLREAVDGEALRGPTQEEAKASVETKGLVKEVDELRRYIRESMQDAAGRYDPALFDGIRSAMVELKELEDELAGLAHRLKVASHKDGLSDALKDGLKGDLNAFLLSRMPSSATMEEYEGCTIACHDAVAEVWRNQG